MNFKQLASLIAEVEGKKDQESIGNIREALRITLTVLANMEYAEVSKLLSKYVGKEVKK